MSELRIPAALEASNVISELSFKDETFDPTVW